MSIFSLLKGYFWWILYLSNLVGRLVYLIVTLPNIAYVIHLVCQFLSSSQSTHYAIVFHILRYVKGTNFHGLHFSSASYLDLQCYYDTDQVGDLIYHHCTTGYCSFQSHHSSLGEVRSEQLCSALTLRLNITLLQMQHPNQYGYNSYFMIWVFLIIPTHPFIVIIKVLFRQFIMMSFISVLSISRLIITLFIIVCFNRHFILLLLPLKLKKLIFLPSHFPLVNFLHKLLNSNWLLCYHPEFERGQMRRRKGRVLRK